MKQVADAPSLSNNKGRLAPAFYADKSVRATP